MLIPDNVAQRDQIAALELRVAELVGSNDVLRHELAHAADLAKALVDGQIDAVAAESGATPLLLLAAQERLRDREKILGAIFEGALDGFVLADDDGRFVSVNAATCTLFGLAEAMLVGRTFVEISGISNPRGGMFALLDGGRHRGEIEIRRPDGTRRAFEFSSVANIVPGLHLSVLRDITERQGADELLRASEERYRRIIDTTSEGVWLSDAAYITTFVNQRMADMLGYAREEMVGAPISEFLTAEGLATAKVKFERRRVGFGETYPNSYRRKDGSTCWALARTNAIFDENGEFGGTVGLLSNLTEQRKVEEARDRLAAIVESSRDAIFSKTADGLVTSWNRAAEELFGYMAEEIIGQAAVILVPPGAVDENVVISQSAQGERSAERETVRRCKDGSLIEVSIHVSLLTDPEGQVVGASTIARDIRERRKQQAALRRSEEQFRQSHKMEAIGSLAGGLAHDFNNILSVILGYTSLLLQEFEPGNPARGDLQEIHKAGVRAAELTKQLLAFSRQQMLEPRVLDLNAVIVDIQKMLVRMLGESVSLSLQTSDSLGKVYADAGQFEQVLMNLVINARDAMPRGGSVTLETSNVLIDAAEAAERGSVTAGRFVMLSVTDTGSGIDEATLARIFDPFFSTKEIGKGTGLGLSTVHGIIEQSGGHIRVKSVVGRGTRFEILLPRTDRASVARPSVPVQAKSHRGSETILLVEDEDQVRHVMRSILQKQGYEVLEAQNAGEAFLISEERGPTIQLLVTDVVMPRMSGGELANRLSTRHPNMAVLYVSGYAKDAAVVQGVVENGQAFLAKPVTPDTLARKVRDVLDDAASARSVRRA